MSTVDAIGVFLVEAHDLLDGIEQGLLDLEVRQTDRSLVDSIFRGLHTLKGSGAMFGFDDLAKFTHHCENAFDRVRKGEAAVTSELISAVLAAKDHMRALVERPSGDHAAMGESLLAGLRAALEKSPVGEEVKADPVKQTWKIHFKLPARAFVSGINPLALLSELRALGECVVVGSADEVPAWESLSPTECHLAWTVILTTDQPRSAIEDVFIFVIDEMNLVIEPVHPTTASVGVCDAPPLQPEPVAVAGPMPIQGTGGGSRPGESRADESVRVPAGRLDELMDRVGELVITQARLRQLALGRQDAQLRSVSEEIERLANELRNTTMVLRMVPVGALFGRFRRLVHDLARETGKEIALSFDGESTEVDKTVAERLSDPLIHLVRNAVDHGLETPERRRAAGKPEMGQLRLSARQAGGEVVITIEDDGLGVDRERVRARAEKQGLLEPDTQISDAKLLQFLFNPGFSTAQQVTSLSGRGVGLDVVKRTVEALRGSIDIVSKPGEGTQFSLRIPLTLAIIDGLLVRIGQGRYVIPLASVEECVELSHEMDMRSTGRCFITLRDCLVPFLRLREMFDTGTKPDAFQKIVVVSTGSERVGLVVDQILGDHQTVIKPLSRFHTSVETFSGATILGDGSVALILDVPHLVAHGQELEERLRAAG